LYEIETDDIASVFKELKRREAEAWVISDTLDLRDFSTSIFEVIGNKVTGQTR
jgi:hypothetical protein